MHPRSRVQPRQFIFRWMLSSAGCSLKFGTFMKREFGWQAQFTDGDTYCIIHYHTCCIVTRNCSRIYTNKWLDQHKMYVSRSTNAPRNCRCLRVWSIRDRAGARLLDHLKVLPSSMKMKSDISIHSSVLLTQRWECFSRTLKLPDIVEPLGACDLSVTLSLTVNIIA